MKYYNGKVLLYRGFPYLFPELVTGGIIGKKESRVQWHFEEQSAVQAAFAKINPRYSKMMQEKYKLSEDLLFRPTVIWLWYKPSPDDEVNKKGIVLSGNQYIIKGVGYDAKKGIYNAEVCIKEEI